MLTIFVRCTTVSALKIWDQERHRETHELTWDVVSMTLWATAENTVGIMVANLPSLRKPFKKLFRSILQSTNTGNVYSSNKAPGEHYDTFRMQSYRTESRRKSMMEGMKGRSARLPSTVDDESDKAILKESDKDLTRHRMSPVIFKTTEVTVHHDGRA